MSARIDIDELFEQCITYPDVDARYRFAALIGLDDQKTRLTKILRPAWNPPRGSTRGRASITRK